MRRGFTLLELLISLALVGLAVGLGVMSVHQAALGQESRALAQVVAERLRLARQDAIASGAPVAVAFPSAQGQTAMTQSLYLVSGWQAQTTQIASYASEFPHSCILVGYWQLDTSQLNDATATNVTWQPQNGTNYDSFNVSSWLGTSFSDPALLFTPSGSVVSNGMVRFDRNYHVVISEGAQFTSAGNPGGPGGLSSYYMPTVLSEPYTITISPLGSITWSPSLTAVLAGAVQNQSSAALAAVASPPSIPVVGSSPPVIVSTAVLPTPNPNTLPSGTVATCASHEYLTLSVSATSPYGLPLSCTWSAASGVFSAPNGSAMQYDVSSNTWSSTCQWSPGSGAPANQVGLTCNVKDSNGNAATAPLISGSGQVQVLPSWMWSASVLINFGSSNPAFVLNCLLNSDGTAPRLLHIQKYAASPHWGSASFSPDGSKILYMDPSDVWSVMNADGTDPTIVTLGDGWMGGQCWEPHGTRLVYSRTGAPPQVVVVNVDGSAASAIYTDVAGAFTNYSAWSPNGSQIAFVGSSDGQLYSIHPDGSGRLPLTTAATLNGQVGWPPIWSPDGSKICFERLISSTTTREVFVVNADGSGLTQLTVRAAGGQDVPVAYSPDGTKIAFQRAEPGSSDFEGWITNSDGSNQLDIGNPLPAGDCGNIPWLLAGSWLYGSNAQLLLSGYCGSNALLSFFIGNASGAAATPFLPQPTNTPPAIAVPSGYGAVPQPDPGLP